MSARPSWPFRLALQLVPGRWRASVREDLADEAGRSWWATWWCALEAFGIALSLHWVFTRAAIMSDIRYAIRSLLHARAFALGAIATFALGIGVNVAVFSAVDRMLFRTLPYGQPDALVVMGQYPVGDSRPYATVSASYVVQARQLPAVVDLSTSTWNADSYRIAQNPDGARYLSFVQVSYNMLRVLGVHPVVGQDFTERDAREKQHRVLIAYSVWQRDFGGRSDVIGKPVWAESAQEGAAEIVGVLPEDFIPPQVSLPNLGWNGLSVTDDTFDDAKPTDRTTPPFVRLRPGVSLSVAQAQLDALVTQLKAQEPAPRPGTPATAVRLVPLRDALFGRYETYLALVFAAATLVLLVGCANLGSLLLVRARSREHRAAVQLALGASAGRVMQAAVVEALLLAVAGCALALLVLELGNHAIATWLPPLFSKYAAPVFATRVLVFSSLLATASAVVAGVLPGWRSARVDVLAILQRGTGRVGAGRLRGSGSLLAGEVAVSLVLVACAALTGRSLIGLLRTDVGFDMDRLQFVSAYLPASKDTALLRQQYGEVLEVIRTIPGVQAATGANVLPIMGAVSERLGAGIDGGQRWLIADEFVETMGMRVLAGRTISKAEVQAMAPVGMLSQSGVSLVWPGVSPQQAVGRFLEFPNEEPRQVVGIVSDVRGSYAQQPYPSLYVPVGPTRFRSLLYAVRMAPQQTLTVADLTHRLQERGYTTTRAAVNPVTDRFDQGVVDQKFRAELFSAFGLIALLLAVIGLYAVQSFNVGLRQTEFGIRISLGATPGDLWRMLIRQTMRPVVVGLGLGMIATYWAAQVLQGFLVEVDARDPWTYALVATVLLAATVLAAWLPARRAARTDPSEVLRAQ